MSYQTLTNELCQLWSEWTEVHEIFTASLTSRAKWNTEIRSVEMRSDEMRWVIRTVLYSAGFLQHGSRQSWCHREVLSNCKKNPYIHWYFVASFPHFNGTGSVTLQTYPYVDGIMKPGPTLTVTVSLLEIAVKDRIARQSDTDKQYKLQNQTTRFKNNSWKLCTNTIHQCTLAKSYRNCNVR